MTAFFAMKESHGTPAMINGFTRGFRKEEMQNNSPGKERRMVWMGTQDGGT